VRFVFELRKWIASQPQIPTTEQITQHYMDDLRRGAQRPSREFSLFTTYLKAELQERPKTIAEIAAEAAEKKLAPKTLSLGSRVFQRMRARSPAEPKPTEPKHRKHGPDKKPAEQSVWFEIGRKVEELISKSTALIDARRQIAGKYEYDTVVRYHRKYRGWLRNSPTNPG
jgi:hypothetical protein